MPGPLSGDRHDYPRQRINRAPSPVLAVAAPWVLVMLGSLASLLPLVASAPVLPPLGFLFLMAWQQLRPGLFPVWAGLPLGLFDDLFSGQPFGSAMALWSIAMIGMDYFEARFPWRGFALDWLLAAGVVAAYLLLALTIANLAGGATPVQVVLPQLAVAVLAYPLAARIVGATDRFRLIAVRQI
ncbi:rod shape-determining protein MreD [Novosphingobium sp.]|uniref:rod shape-determining protein MreD n=1 Tax=Novosphingobium sp. TaxID=1874826 RepID=UPI00273772C6|nr:rod shape-determining protein MreD [Novosphingobium sp.]MDP3905949.1 rod shape-determining protein MreD [Novosphingobium sp.]